ncbi:radical SAM/SPASM domain-containing protein [Sulfobacillus thermosulfidooxidans]|uniref:radical SAM/SPASM domain-containing protein n=1 Tax=Sulfobacillus thermosulfidooxidans TaxID=28034 RepID=UPI0006B64BA8|nr:radical SAM protein [Sulfobacillus thermosulfidooxidans]
MERTKCTDTDHLVNWSRYNVIVPSGEMRWLLYNTATARLLAFKADPQPIQAYYEEGNELFAGHEKLYNLGFLVDQSINELSVVRNEFDRLKDPRSQSLLILPTEQCNFRCVYCYEEFIKPKMAPDIRQGLITWVRNHAPQWNDFSVAWFGGEPLVAYDVVHELSEAFIDICSSTRCHYRASMTTNGYLLKFDRVQQLHELGVHRYQITLDGVEDKHDIKRHLISGKGTYDTIMQNLMDIHHSELDVSITIRMNIDQNNGPHLYRLIEVLAEKLEGDSRFQFSIHLIGKWGGRNDNNLSVYEQNDGVCTLTKVTQYGIEKGLNTGFFEQMLPHTPCYAAMPNSLVIGSDGIVYKCTVAFDNPINHVGKLYPDGRLDINEQYFAQWVVDGATDSSCQSCQVHPMCHGASCPVIRIEENTRPCPTVRKDLPAFIRLLDINMQMTQMKNRA